MSNAPPLGQNVIGASKMSDPIERVPGFSFFDHVAISVRHGDLEPQVAVYKAMGFTEIHREDVLGSDQVREVLLQVGGGPNLIQLLEPLTPDSPVAKQITQNGGRGGLAHVALRVSDIKKAFDYLKQQGFNIIDTSPEQAHAEQPCSSSIQKRQRAQRSDTFWRSCRRAVMSDEHAGAEHLNLRENFPAVPTDTWEDAIRSFLEGAPETELVWHSDEGLVVHPYYRSDALAGLQTQTSAIPGQFPFVRGPGREWKIDETGLMQGNSVRADLVLEAGGDSIQQLGIAIAEGVEKLTVLGETRSIDLAAREIQFVFGIGSTYFFEIAKLRAARMLWARVVEQFKPINLDSCGMNLHARTVRINKSFCDPHTNILRATTEAMAAGIGGCDSLTVEPFAFDRQIAINIQRVLAEEAHLNIVADPAGGSYYIEALTTSLARAAWTLFQRIEASGGYISSINWLAGEIAQSRAARENDVVRRRTLVGVNNYPNPAEEFLSKDSRERIAGGPFPQFRLAEPFEASASAPHAILPKPVALQRSFCSNEATSACALRGDSLNLFGCAGFDIDQLEEYAETDADLIVLCSSDPSTFPWRRRSAPP